MRFAVLAILGLALIGCSAGSADPASVEASSKDLSQASKEMDKKQNLAPGEGPE